MATAKRIHHVLRQVLASSLAYYLLFAVLIVVVGRVGLTYALERTFQVDEFQMAQNAVLMAKGAEWLDYAPIRPFYLVLISQVLEPSWDTVTTLSVLRAIFFALFLINLYLIAQVQPYVRSRWGKLLVLTGVISVFPLWEHGIEVRGDNVVLFSQLLGMGLVFAAMNSSGRRRLALFFLLGVAASGTHYGASKGFVIWPPHVGMALLTCWLGESQRRWRQLFCWAAMIAVGMLVGAWFVWLIGYSAGTLREGAMGGGLRPQFVKMSLTTRRFSAWPLLRMEIVKNPALSVACLLAALRYGKELLAGRWRCNLPVCVSAVYFCWSLAFLHLNPVPYPYNMLHVVPFAFIFALSATLICRPLNLQLLLPLLFVQVLSVIREAQVSPFFLQGNYKQTSYITAAESLTPFNEPVLDGVGMVTSRPPPSKDWWLHSMHMAAYNAGLRENYADIMRDKLPPVVITNYRWRWLKGDEWKVLQENYVAVTADFYVLGSRLREGQQSFHLARPGRYLLRLDDQRSDGVTIDGLPCDDGQFMRLTAGLHSVEVVGGAQLLRVSESTEQFPSLIGIGTSADELFLKR